MDYLSVLFLNKGCYIIFYFISIYLWVFIDMDFFFKCLVWYFVCECFKWVRFKVEFEKINFIFLSNYVLIICFLYKYIDDDVFDDFLKIIKYFLEIYKEFFKVVWRLDKCFLIFFKNVRSFLKIINDC